MAEITLNQLGTELGLLKKEVAFLRSVLASIAIKDREGEYKTRFIRKIRQAVQEKADYSFGNPNAFLSQLKAV